MSNILLRIKILAQSEGITIGALERGIGASKGVLSRAISNGTDIQSKWLVAIVEKYPHYSARWLLTGEGEMKESQSPKLENQEKESKSGDNLVDFLKKMVQDRDAIIGKLREEIGGLKALLELTKHKDTIWLESGLQRKTEEERSVTLDTDYSG